MRFWLIPDDCPGLLRDIMQYFQGDGSFISLEGALSGSLLDTLQNSSTAETPLLRRNISSPPLDFLVAPLSAHNIQLIRQAVESLAAKLTRYTPGAISMGITSQRWEEET